MAGLGPAIHVFSVSQPVMAGLGPAIHVFFAAAIISKSWMPGTRRGMTIEDRSVMAVFDEERE